MRASSTLSLSALFLIVLGCSATKKNVKNDEPEQQATTTAEVATPVATAAPVKQSLEQGQYTIKNRDTLWDISSGKVGYEDPYYWPALFRANRDVIEDPDLIYVDEQIKIPKGLSDVEMDDARKRAQKAPAYEPHVSPKPREALDYLLD